MRRLPLITFLLALAFAAPAQAALKPPMVLPGDAGAASTADWIVGARPGAAADAIAARHRAPRLGTGSYVPPRGPAHRPRLLRPPARPRARALLGAREPPLLRRAEPQGEDAAGPVARPA